MRLQEHIARLLERHNCVIIPGFGGFIGNYEPAFVNRSSYIIFPPRKQVLFNANLVKNDGLLANALMEDEGLSYADALNRIAGVVSEWKNSIELGERLELGEIGFLFLQDKQVVFEQNRDTNLLLQSYGLKQVSYTEFNVRVFAPLKESEKVKAQSVAEKKPKKEPVIATIPLPVAEEKTPVIALDPQRQIEVIADTPEETPVVDIATRRSNNRYKYIAAAVALPVLFYSYWIPMETDALNTGKIQFSDFNPLRQQAKRIYQPRGAGLSFINENDWKSWEELTAELPAELAVYQYELDDETFIPVDIRKTKADLLPAAEGSYHVIANCFSSKQNASNFVEELRSKGYNAVIVDQNKGLHRVSAGAYATKTEAEAALESFRNGGFSGWILEP